MKPLVFLFAVASLYAQIGGTSGISPGNNAIIPPATGAVGANNNFVFEGDSIMVGFACSAPYKPGTLAMTLPNLTGRGTGTTTAISGSTIATMQARYVASVHPLSPAVTGRPGYLFIQIGTNDANAAASAATIEAGMSTYWSTALADGWKIIPMTILPAGGIPDYQSVREQVNNWMRAQNGSWNRLIDAAQLLPDPYNANMFDTDKTHPIDGGCAVLARAIDVAASLANSPAIAAPFWSGPGTGINNTRYPVSALQGLTTGQRNAAYGPLAAWQTTTATDSTGFGFQSLSSQTTVGFNSAFGAYSCVNATSFLAHCFGYLADVANGVNSAFQMGTGTNSTTGTLQVFDYNFLNHSTGQWFSKTNCSSSASPAVCGAATSGAVTMAAAATTKIVNTTAVTANSQIMLQFDSSLGTKLSVTCNTTNPVPYVTARTAGTSFTITSAAPTTNPACFSYWIVN